VVAPDRRKKTALRAEEVVSPAGKGLGPLARLAEAGAAFVPMTVCQLWVADITYTRMSEYKDEEQSVRFSVIGWFQPGRGTADRAKPALSALTLAIANRRNEWRTDPSVRPRRAICVRQNCIVAATSWHSATRVQTH
jgi:hypothetical protein